MSSNQTTQPAPGHAMPVQNAARQEQISAALEAIQASKSGGPRDKTVQVIGLTLAIAGAVVALLCYAQAAGFDDLRDQLQVCILAIFGLSLVVLGTGLYLANAIIRFLRLWMLRLVYEQNRVNV